jgi:hypothetical protein
MAKKSIEIITALRATSKKLAEGSEYMWGHMGSCNCGNLAQVVTKFSKSEIHSLAMASNGDWNEQLNDYCKNSGMPLERVMFELISFGFSVEDLQHLEKLNDPEILRRFPKELQYLRHNYRKDVIVYINEWANMLEEQLLEEYVLPKFLSNLELNYA